MGFRVGSCISFFSFDKLVHVLCLTAVLMQQLRHYGWVYWLEPSFKSFQIVLSVFLSISFNTVHHTYCIMSLFVMSSCILHLQFQPIHSLLSLLVHSPLCLHFKIKRFYTFLSRVIPEAYCQLDMKELQCNWQTHTGGRQQERRSLTLKAPDPWSGALSPIKVFVRLQARGEWQLMQYAYSCADRELLLVDSVESAAVDVVGICWELLKIYPQQKDFHWVISWWQMNKLVLVLRVICCNKQPEVTVSESWWFVRVTTVVNIHPFR